MKVRVADIYKLNSSESPFNEDENIVYKIINNQTGKQEGAYTRAAHTEYEFRSVEDARSSNCHDIFWNKRKYRVQKWKVTYELVDDNTDPYRQETIPYYKDHLAYRAFREAMNKDLNNAMIESIKQMNAGLH